MVMFSVLTENILDHQLRRVLRVGDRPICMNQGIWLRDAEFMMLEARATLIIMEVEHKSREIALRISRYVSSSPFVLSRFRSPLL